MGGAPEARLRYERIRAARAIRAIRETRARWITRLLLLAGAAGILDMTGLSIFGTMLNSGTLLFGMAGLALLAWGLWRRRHDDGPLPWPHFLRRGLMLAGLGWVVSFSVFAASLFTASRDESQERVDYAIVLGAGLLHDRISRTLQQRLEVAAAYLRSHPGVSVIASGGMGRNESRPEGEVMAEYLAAHGVAPERILVEGESLSTWQNLSRSRDLLLRRRHELPPVLIVTSDFHVPRAKLLARRLGFAAHGLPCPTPWYLYPNLVAREYFVFAKSWLLDRVRG